MMGPNAGRLGTSAIDPAVLLDILKNASKGGAPAAQAAPNSVGPIGPNDVMPAETGVGAEPDSPQWSGAPNVVKPVPISSPVPAGSGFGTPPAASPQDDSNAKIMSLLYDRLGARTPPPTARERISDMLMNFGKGAIEGASDTSHGPYGTTTLGSLARGGAEMAGGVQAQQAEEKAAGVADQTRTDKLLGNYAKMGIDLTKIHSLEEYRKALLGAKYDDPVMKALLSTLPKLVGSRTADGQPTSVDDLLKMVMGILAMKNRNSSDVSGLDLYGGMGSDSTADPGE